MAVASESESARWPETDCTRDLVSHALAGGWPGDSESERPDVPEYNSGSVPEH